ncbi:hypothetical protein ACN28I_38665 [Archangium gephyra]|uniref:hypothetical protein n=1 Tax=Archangium gephyra TaxID=48 RepID=UPI003B7A4043
MPLDVNLLQLEGEIRAWPLVSERAFRLSLCHLERKGGTASGATRQVWDELVTYLRPRARGLSIEVLRQIRKECWFSALTRGSPLGRERLSLTDFLLYTMKDRLLFLGNQAALRSDARMPIEQQAARWRWLSLMLPPDLLIAAHAAHLCAEPVSDYVSLGASNLANFFEEAGVAQAHLHVGAAVPFEWLWTHLMSRVGRTRPHHSELSASGESPFGSTWEFLAWIVTAALARLTLAAFLKYAEAGRVSTFNDFGRFFPGLRGDAVTYRAALQALMRGEHPIHPLRVSMLLRHLGGVAPNAPLPMSLHDVRRFDPLSVWFPATHGALPETRLMTRGLRFLHQHPRDEDFARLFWQYLRVRNSTYRHLVHEPGTAGLDWFSVHFRRISALRGDLPQRSLTAAALALESRGPPLKSLEVRSSPWSHWHEIRSLVRDVASAPGPDGCEAERGLVIHFLKDRLPRGQGRLLYGDPRQRAHGCRFGSYFYERLRETLAIEKALRRHPELLVILRGIDVCNLEMSVPLWVFLPLLRRLRRASEAVSRALEPHGRIPPLQRTLHAGEDFRRLVEGLRFVHEPIEFNVLTVGDRVGHAISLGLRPERWAQSALWVEQPAEERLDDLLWELARYRNVEMPVEAARLEYIHGEIERLAHHIYGPALCARPPGEPQASRGSSAPSLEDLLLARRLRHDPDFLEALGYPFLRRENPFLRGKHHPRSDTAVWLTWLYLTDFGVYARGRMPEPVEVTDSEVRMLHQAQRFVRSVFSRLGITVEANPSSNMLVGDLPLEEHPVFRLQPLPGNEAPDGATVQVALGDDDPVTFASSLPDEFSHLFYTLIRKGVSTQDALSWLDQVRRNGLRSRFTLPGISVAPRGRPRRRPRQKEECMRARDLRFPKPRPREQEREDWLEEGE